METFVRKLEDATRTGENGFPQILGAVAMVVNGNHRAEKGGGNDLNLTSHASGKTSLSPTAPAITPSSPLRLASCTKLITSLTTLRLIQNGTLDLNSTALISQHLPELCSQEIISLALPGELNGSAPAQNKGKEEGEGGKEGVRFIYTSRKNPITLSQLLTHSAGTSYDVLSPTLLAWRESRGETPMALSGVPVPDAISYPLVFQPGEGWTYGAGPDWVGLLIERVTGEKLGDVMRREVFDVVGCDGCIGFSRDAVEASHGESVVQCVFGSEEGDGGAMRLSEYPAVDAEGHRGGGGLFASAENFARILADLVSGESRLLGKEMLDVLFGARFEEGGLEIQALRMQSPVFLSMTGALTGSLDAKALNHALGGLLIMQDNEALGKTKGTLTWGGAFNCVWFANREQRLAGFYGSSMFPPGEAKSSELMGEFMKAAWNDAK